MAEAVAAAKTVVDQVYRSMRESILNGELVAGSKLKLETLVADFGAGMSTVREALVKLAGERLVTSEGQRGFWVAPLSLEELDDLCRVRALIETEALNQAVQLGGAEWEQGVRESYQALSDAEDALPVSGEAAPDAIARWEACNRDFHVALVSGCGSPWLMHLNEILYRQTERYRRVSLQHGLGHRFVHDEHAAIFDAAMARNALRLCRLTEKHLAYTADEVRRAVAAMASEDIAA
jgi:GntR family transcriptional regulator, carbon starvation induced regulator